MTRAGDAHAPAMMTARRTANATGNVVGGVRTIGCAATARDGSRRTATCLT
jgi:hypothetical protein